MRRGLTVVAALCSTLMACGGSKECRLDDPGSCPSEQTCEVVSGREKPMCFQPVQLEGKVFDLSSSVGVEKALVTAVDENGAPVGTSAVSASGGKYVLRVPSTRSDEKGTFVSRKVSLRVQAAGYSAFPSGLRVALPIDTSAAAQVEASKAWVLSGGPTDVGLFVLPDAERSYPSISGTVEVASNQGGVLVVAQTSGKPGATAAVDQSGKFRLFNLAPGAYRLQAYGRSVSYAPVDVTVEAGKDVTGVELKRSTAPTGTLSGTVSLVAGSKGPTSVVLVVDSTFNENLLRGEVPPGLRAPDPGTAPNVTGAWSITGVPDGTYVVLAAFENDGNVRDPDPNISGTQLQRVTLSNGSASAQPAFKVTGAIEMVGPGATAPMEEVSGTPSFTWRPYPSAKVYEVVVLDSQGNRIWERKDIPEVKNASGNVVVPYAGTALTAGQVYQWRALARGNALNPISQTEELRGIFVAK